MRCVFSLLFSFYLVGEKRHRFFNTNFACHEYVTLLRMIAGRATVMLVHIISLILIMRIVLLLLPVHHVLMMKVLLLSRWLLSGIILIIAVLSNWCAMYRINVGRIRSAHGP